MDNPFAVLERRLNRLESLLEEIKEANVKAATPTPAQEVPVKIDRVCQLLNISVSTARIWMREGKLPFKRKGKRVFFYESEVLNSLEQPMGRRA